MFGPHVNREHARARARARPTITQHVAAARAQAAEVGVAAQAMQIFLASPRKMVMTMEGDEAAELAEYLRQEGVWGVAHNTYTAYPWRDDAKARHAASFVREELQLAAAAGLHGLVVHLPAEPDAVLRHIHRLYAPEDDDKEGGAEEGQARARIYLEPVYPKPEKSRYETPEKLADLFRRIRAAHDPGLQRTGLCIDTAHLWASGVDLTDYEDAEEWLERLDAVADVIPPNCIMFHLNDSEKARGGGQDHHAGLFRGRMWERHRADPAASGASAFVEYAIRHNIPAILERRPVTALSGDYMYLHQLAPELRLRSPTPGA